MTNGTPDQPYIRVLAHSSMSGSDKYCKLFVTHSDTYIIQKLLSSMWELKHTFSTCSWLRFLIYNWSGDETSNQSIPMCTDLYNKI